ncbi:hypothetical protein EWS82_13190, partial [Staphylococcus xylosus]|nr:hypothetical protein [Staphylococcus xylosus]
KLIVGVDRLDYIKGVPQKLHALEVFLTEHPEWIGKIVLVQVAVPSRQDVEEYQNLRAVVNELVDWNGRFVTVGAFPIGIDPEKFVEGLQRPKVQERIATLSRKFQGVKLIVGVDRLDYIKGVPQKLHALEVFLTEHPEW